MLALSKENHPSSVIGLTLEGSRAVICNVYCYQHAVVVSQQAIDRSMT